MIMATLFSLAFALLSAGVWNRARAGRGRWSGVVAALVLLLVLALLDGLGRFSGLPAAAGLSGLVEVVVRAIGSVVAAAEQLAAQTMPGLSPALGIQLVVLSGYFLLRGTVGLLFALALGLRWLWRHLRRQRSMPALPPRAEPGQVALLRAVRGTLLVLGALLVLSPLLERYTPALMVLHGQLFWVGAWVLLLELGGRLAAEVQPYRKGLLQAQPARSRPVDALRGLYGRYRAEHREALFLCRVQPPAETEHSAVAAPEGGSAALLHARLAPILSPALLERLLAPARHHDAGGDLLLGESLCSHHFLLISELIQGTVNAGRGVLILCPAAAVPEVQRSLELHGDSNLRRLGQRWAQLGRDQLLEDVREDLLICPDDALEQAALQDLDRLRGRIERLGLLICLDIQALGPPSLVRFSLARLYAVARSRPRLLMQGAAYAQVEALARSLYAADGLRELQVQAQLAGRRYVLVWDRDAPEPRHRERRLPGLQQPVGLDCLLMLPAWEQGLRVARLDPCNRHDEDAFERFRAMLPEQGHGALAAIADAHEPVGHGFVGGGAAVSLLDDPGNLLIALDHDGGSNGRVASMIQVLCGNYLMRDYLRAILAANPVSRLPLALRPRATRPRGNPYTLAHCLLHALADDGGLTRPALEEQLFGLVSPLLLRRLGIHMNRAGLQRLLDLAYGDRAAAVLVHWPSRGERRYRVSPMHRPALADWADVRNEQGECIGRLLRWDHGLTYAAGQHLMLRHKLHQVVGVDADMVRVRHADSALGRGPRREVCDRRYRLHLPDPPILEQAPITRQRLGGPSLTLGCGYLEMHRETVGWLSVSDACRPFASMPPDLHYSPCEPPIRWWFQLQGVAHLRIEPPPAAATRDGSNRSDDANGTGRIAFTLCALMQDALHSLFPDHHRQLAVVSPQSAHPADAGPPMAAFLARWYPRLDGIGGLAPIASRGVDLFVIEDSRFDLGVVRALGDDEGLDQLLGNLRLYLDWLLGAPAQTADSDPPTLATGAFQRFGADALDPVFDYVGVRDLLAELIEPPARPAAGSVVCESPPPDDGDAPSQCDFCAAPVGADYHRLDDGRVRCRHCGDDAIDSVDAFRSLYLEVREQMEQRYRISLPRTLELRFVDAHTLGRAAERRFIPTTGLNPRAVGLAIRSEDGGPRMLIENGAPRLSTLATLAHELTHIWQCGLGLRLDERHRPLIEAQARLAEIDLLRHARPRIPGAAVLAAERELQVRTGDPAEADTFERLHRRCRHGRGLFRCLEQELRGIGAND